MRGPALRAAREVASQETASPPGPMSPWHPGAQSGCAHCTHLLCTSVRFKTKTPLARSHRLPRQQCCNSNSNSRQAYHQPSTMRAALVRAAPRRSACWWRSACAGYFVGGRGGGHAGRWGEARSSSSAAVGGHVRTYARRCAQTGAEARHLLIFRLRGCSQRALGKCTRRG
jgi:hypothetical protein